MRTEVLEGQSSIYADFPADKSPTVLPTTFTLAQLMAPTPVPLRDYETPAQFVRC